MLTFLLAIILIGIVGFGIYVGHGIFFKKIVCFCLSLYASVILTPLLLPLLNRVLEGIIPPTFMRIILALTLLIAFYAIVKKIWLTIASKSPKPSIEDGTSKRSGRLILGSCINAALGFFIFIMLLLGFATAVDYKITQPIVSSETYYQTIANKVSDILLNKIPKSPYIVSTKQAPAVRPVTPSVSAPIDDHDDYSNLPVHNHPHTATTKKKPTKKMSATPIAETVEAKKPFEFPEVNLNEEDVEALQEMVTDEVKNLLSQSPDELKRALSDVLTEEKGAELSAMIDEHIKNGQSINKLMENIETIMGDPNNLSDDFKEALPDMLREMDALNE